MTHFAHLSQGLVVVSHISQGGIFSKDPKVLYKPHWNAAPLEAHTAGYKKMKGGEILAKDSRVNCHACKKVHETCSVHAEKAGLWVLRLI